MKKSKFPSEQIVRILQVAESGAAAQAELCPRHDVSQNTFYVWKRTYSGLQTEDVRQLQLVVILKAFEELPDDRARRFPVRNSESLLTFTNAAS